MFPTASTEEMDSDKPKMICERSEQETLEKNSDKVPFISNDED